MSSEAAAGQALRARSLIAIGVATVLAGIAFAAADDAMLGAWLTLPSLSLLIYALHRFGRSGPDPSIDYGPLEPDAAKKKKRRRKRETKATDEDDDGSEEDDQNQGEAGEGEDEPAPESQDERKDDD